MKKLAVTTALALVLAGSAYAQGHHGGGGSIGGGGGAQVSGGAHGGGGAGFNGSAHVGGGGQAMMSHGSAGPSAGNRGAMASHNGSGSMRGSQFSGADRGAQGRTVYNQQGGNRSVYDRYDDRDRGRENFSRDRGHESLGRDRDRGMDFRHRGVVRGNFSEHGRHFGFRRFWHDEWVYLTDWDSCTAWAWVPVAPGVFAWRPVDVCIG